VKDTDNVQTNKQHHHNMPHPSMSRRDKEMLPPIRRNENLSRVHLRAHSHPLIILWVHPTKTLQVPKPRGHVLAQMTRVRRAVLVEVFKIRTEEVRWVGTLGEAPLLCVVLEEVDI
jgi:hypothetical protein